MLTNSQAVCLHCLTPTQAMCCILRGRRAVLGIDVVGTVHQWEAPARFRVPIDLRFSCNRCAFRAVFKSAVQILVAIFLTIYHVLTCRFPGILSRWCRVLALTPPVRPINIHAYVTDDFRLPLIWSYRVISEPTSHMLGLLRIPDYLESIGTGMHKGPTALPCGLACLSFTACLLIHGRAI